MLDVFAYVKYITKVNFTYILLLFNNVNTGKFKTTHVAHIMFLLDSSALECNCYDNMTKVTSTLSCSLLYSQALKPVPVT